MNNCIRRRPVATRFRRFGLRRFSFGMEVKTVQAHTMPRVLSLAVAAVAVTLLSCSGTESDFPAVEGWTQAGEVKIYDADNLWEYIDGAAELFVEYDVQSCRTADLSSGDLTVTVDLYDMGTPLNAFGVFKREHPGKGTPLPGATEAVVSPPYQALLLKDGTYVKVNTVDGELSEPTGWKLLEAMARALPGQTAYPVELDLLPSNGKVAGSEGYKREAFLGLEELGNCVYAEYSGGGDEAWQGFVLLPASGSSPTSAWDALAAQWDSVQHGDVTVLYREIPYSGLVGVVRTDRGIVGAAGATDQAEMLSRLERLTQ